MPQVYLTHYTRHSTSAKRLNDTLTWLSQYNVKPALIKDFDREEMKDEHVTCFNPSTQSEKYSPCPAQKVQVGAISLAIKHFKAFFDMVQNGYPYALILEDDLRVCDVFKSNMTEVFHSIMTDLPQSWDIILLGTWNCGWHDTCYKQVNSTKFTYQHKWQNLQATHAYLISLPGVFKMFGSLPLRCPIDVQMDRHLSKAELVTVYPPLFYQDRTIQGTGVRDVFDNIPRHMFPNYTAPKW